MSEKIKNIDSMFNQTQNLVWNIYILSFFNIRVQIPSHKMIRVS